MSIYDEFACPSFQFFWPFDSIPLILRNPSWKRFCVKTVSPSILTAQRGYRPRSLLERKPSTLFGWHKSGVPKFCFVKFRYCEKATKFEKKKSAMFFFVLFFELLGNIKTKWIFFQIFVAFSAYLNFKELLDVNGIWLFSLIRMAQLENSRNLLGIVNFKRRLGEREGVF